MSTINPNLSEEQIRPQSHMKARLQALYTDIAALHGKASSFNRVCCPACGSLETAFEFEKYSFPFERCAQCATVFMNPRASKEDLGQFYKESALYAYWNKHIFKESDQVRREKIYRPRIARIRDICSRLDIRFSTVMDVGAGYGSFLQEFKEAFRDVTTIAVEPNQDLARTCREKGIDQVLCMGVEQVDNCVQADIVCCFEVIEHLHSPHDFLQECQKLLPHQGLLILSCPNYHGFDNLILREHSSAVNHEHINLFNPDSLAVLCRRCGYDVLQTLTPGELDVELVRNEAQRNPRILHNDGFLHHVLMGHNPESQVALQRYLQDNLLSSHMWCVARKLD